MNRCKDCKHWGDPNVGNFGATAMCSRILSLFDSEGVAAQAYIASGDEYADLYTRPDFGCTLWEPKENPE